MPSSSPRRPVVSRGDPRDRGGGSGGNLGPLDRERCVEGHWEKLRSAAEQTAAARRIGGGALSALRAAPLPSAWTDTSYLHSAARRQQVHSRATVALARSPRRAIVALVRSPRAARRAHALAAPRDRRSRSLAASAAVTSIPPRGVAWCLVWREAVLTAMPLRSLSRSVGRARRAARRAARRRALRGQS